METPQHGNGPTQKRTKKWLLVRFLLFSRIIGIPSKTEKWSNFRIFLIHFRYVYIWFVSRFFWIGFRIIFSGPFPVFSKSFKILICWSVSCFFFDPFPHILCSFLVFGKSYKFSVCWLASFFTVRVLIFQGCLRFKKNCKFSFYWSVSCFFRSVSAYTLGTKIEFVAKTQFQWIKTLL